MRRGAVAVERCRHDHGCGNAHRDHTRSGDHGGGSGLGVARGVPAGERQKRDKTAAAARFDAVFGESLVDVSLPGERVKIVVDLDNQQVIGSRLFPGLDVEERPNALGCGPDDVVHEHSLRRCPTANETRRPLGRCRVRGPAPSRIGVGGLPAPARQPG
jgi:hypothetical protein